MGYRIMAGRFVLRLSPSLASSLWRSSIVGLDALLEKLSCYCCPPDDSVPDDFVPWLFEDLNLSAAAGSDRIMGYRIMEGRFVLRPSPGLASSLWRSSILGLDALLEEPSCCCGPPDDSVPDDFVLSAAAGE